jgi:hypothetical protein
MIGHFTTNITPQKIIFKNLKKKILNEREKKMQTDRYFSMNEWNHDSRDGCKI